MAIKPILFNAEWYEQFWMGERHALDGLQKMFQTTHIGLNLFMKMAAFNLIVFILRM